MAPILRWTARDPAGELRAGSKGTAGLATRRWRLWLARSEMALAVDHYKLAHRRRFITYEEMLSVVKSLGYHK
jgi:hypothetical protein